MAAIQVGRPALCGHHGLENLLSGVSVLKVYQAINAVQRALAVEGISKSRTNSQQGYKFRGIDDVYNVVSPLLGQHGLCILPRMLERYCEERQTAKGGALFYVTVEAEFDFVSSEDASKHTVRTFGEAMDSGDKATNKAMSAAYKYAVMQAFAIPTEGDNDADSTTHTPQPKQAISATAEAWKECDEDTKRHLQKVAQEVTGCMPDANKALAALEAASLQNEHKAALWHLLDSSTRSAIKRATQ